MAASMSMGLGSLFFEQTLIYSGQLLLLVAHLRDLGFLLKVAHMLVVSIKGPIKPVFHVGKSLQSHKSNPSQPS